jgi:hypothetical protein
MDSLRRCAYTEDGSGGTSWEKVEKDEYKY